MPAVLVIGAFDTKGAEYDFLLRQVASQGCGVLTMNVGVMGTTDLFPVDVEADEVARAGGAELRALRAAKDRGEAMKAMTRGAAVVVRRLFDERRFDGIIGMGGTGGTSVITAAMRTLPVGVPKVCVSTAAGANAGPYVGISDVVLIPSIVDVAGVNRMSLIVMSRAGGAIGGMGRA